jgi:hypothetical protein
MEGIKKMVFLPDKDVFELSYIPSVMSLEKIFKKIEALGEERNLPYKASYFG